MKGNGYVALLDPGLGNLVLVEVVPERLELVVYDEPGLEPDEATWRPPAIELGPAFASGPPP